MVPAFQPTGGVEAHLRYKAMLFDLDGTLIDTVSDIHGAVSDALLELGLPPLSAQQVRDRVGHGTQSLMLHAYSDLKGVTPASVEQSGELTHIMAIYARCYLARCGQTSKLYPHVRAALEALRSQGVKLAVVTNKESRFTMPILDAHQLTDLFDRVVCGDTFPIRKPDPAGVNACMAQFGTDVSNTLFVGDSSVDVATARQAGVAVWALPYGYNMGQPIEASQPDRLIEDFSVFLPVA